MQKGSLVMLTKSLSWRDYELAKTMGTKVPERDVFYTISRGPFLIYCYIQKRSMLTIQIEELGICFYDPKFFVEVQKPMKVELEALLIN